MNSMKINQCVKLWRKDINKFAIHVFGFIPTPQQRKIFDALALPSAKVTVKAGHGVGKSAVAAIFAVWHCLMFEDSKTILTAPSSAQLKDVLCAEIGKWVNQIKIPQVKELIEVTSMGAFIKGRQKTQFISARTARKEDPSALQGIHAKHAAYVCDEAFGIHSNIYEVARGALTSDSSRCLLIGNPTALSGYAYETHNKNKRLWSRLTLSCIDSNLVSEDYVKEMKLQYGEESDVYKVRVLGEFPSASVNQLIPRSLAEESAKRKIHSSQYDYAPIIIGCDPAWEGDDRTAVYLRQGIMCKKLGVWYSIDNMTLGGMLDQFWTKENADAMFIDVGWGAGIIDYLRSIGRNPIPVNFGGKSISNEYANKRTEMHCELKKWMEDGGIIEDDNELIEDLTAPEYYFQASGKKILEQKKEMKKRGLPSNDLGDALALTFAQPVYKQTARELFAGNNSHQAKKNWDVI